MLSHVHTGVDQPQVQTKLPRSCPRTATPQLCACVYVNSRCDHIIFFFHTLVLARESVVAIPAPNAHHACMLLPSSLPWPSTKLRCTHLHLLAARAASACYLLSAEGESGWQRGKAAQPRRRRRRRARQSKFSSIHRRRARFFPRVVTRRPRPGLVFMRKSLNGRAFVSVSTPGNNANRRETKT